jgi:hypothetical protein
VELQAVSGCIGTRASRSRRRGRQQSGGNEHGGTPHVVGAAGLEPAILPVPNRALYQAELRPVALERAHSMAVRTHQLTLRDLVGDGLPAETPTHQVADVIQLVTTMCMIPLHRGVMVDTSAIGARQTFLQRSRPRRERTPAALDLAASALSRAAPVLSVVFLATRLAPELRPAGASVEVALALHQAAASTRPLHVVSMEITPDDIPVAHDPHR